MSELIDRQQAIDAIAQCTNCGDEDTLREYVLKHNLDNGWTGGILEALDAVKDLPTAQSEKTQLSQEGTTSDMISRKETIKHLQGVLDVTVPITDYDGGYVDGVEVGISTVSTMPPIQPVATDTNVGDTISRQAALEKVRTMQTYKLFADISLVDKSEVQKELMMLPPAQPEALTDKEQRIFLAAMGREEKVCRQVDDECRDCREPYEDSLVRTCHEITRKVKGALWT